MVDTPSSQDSVSLIDSGFAASQAGYAAIMCGVHLALGEFLPASGLHGISSDSAASNVNSYVYENGRRYHAYRAGKYILPNDEPEIRRLELHHHLFLMLLGGALHRAPLNDPQIVLDVGTGAGEWAIDMAEQYPDAKVIGNDLSRIQPPWIPANCVFEVDDAESEWVYPSNHFDFVHMRSMSGSFSDWPLLLSRIYEHLKPGGFVEFQDHGACLFVEGPDPAHLDALNPVSPPSTPFSDWWTLMLRISEARGRPLVVARDMEDLMRDAGFVDITVEIKAWPLTPWPEIKELNEIGTWGRQGMMESLNSFSTGLLTRELKWSEKEVRDKILAAAKDLILAERRFWVQTFFIYGKKPDDVGSGSSDNGSGGDDGDR